MIFLGIFLGIIIMGVMIYFAINKKSNSSTRIASLIALGVMILTVIICLFLILTDNTVPVDESILIVGAPIETDDNNVSSIWVFLFLVVFLLTLFVVITIHALRENKKNANKLASKAPAKKSGFLGKMGF